MRKLTGNEAILLDLWLWPLRAAGEAAKAEWRRQRDRDLEALGLPARRGEGDQE